MTSRSVYVHGQATVTFDGSFPATIRIDPTKDLVGFPDNTNSFGEGSAEIAEVNGSWVCTNDDSSLNTAVTLGNGQSVTIDLWIFADVLSDTQPTVTAADVPEWAFAGTLATDTSDTLSTVHFSGPHATSCAQTGGDTAVNQPAQSRIGLFQAPPYTLRSPTADIFTCGSP